MRDKEGVNVSERPLRVVEKPARGRAALLRVAMLRSIARVCYSGPATSHPQALPPPPTMSVSNVSSPSLDSSICGICAARALERAKSADFGGGWLESARMTFPASSSAGTPFRPMLPSAFYLG
jgi:hypothetical protein